MREYMSFRDKEDYDDLYAYEYLQKFLNKNKIKTFQVIEIGQYSIDIMYLTTNPTKDAR